MSRPTYLPWVRAGLVATVTNPDPLSGALPAHTTFPVTAAAATGDSRSVDIRLMGPGDVTGIDPGLITAVQPTDGAIEVEPNYFCVAELPSADLPWMFTPAAPNQDRLRPFLVLVVVPAEANPLTPGAADRLPVLHVTDASTELPDLAQSYAWAHAEVPSVAGLAESARTTGIARLMCPRLLASRTAYVAAVVPAFEPGRLSGLGLPLPDGDTIRPAWDTAVAGPVDLPVYHSWTFTTGDDGDFEALATRLRRVRLGADTEAGRLAVVDAQAGLPALTDWRFPGALGRCPDPLPGADFTGPLTALVDGTALAAGLPVPPPSYGGRHAADGTLAATTKPWLRRLNLDPRYRAAAALGTRIVQEHQEALMAAAWAQIGEVETANALLRQGQLARAAAVAVHARLATLSPAALVQLAGPMLTRLREPATGTTLAHRVAVSWVPGRLTSGAFRRALRPRGPLTGRTGRTAADLLAAVDAGTPVVPPRGRPDGIVTIDAQTPDGFPDWCTITPKDLQEYAGRPQPPANATQWRDLVAALAAVHRTKPPCTAPSPAGGPVPLATAKTAILAATDPHRTVPARIGARVAGPPGWSPADPLAPILATPRIDTPLSRDLIALSPDLLLPGIADLPAEAVSAVPANRRFIEALMIGANQEMMRELLWRGYPTDQRGTPLHRFWDRNGSLGGAGDDIPAIDEHWTGELGTHQTGDPAQVVLVVRGELLRRYPRTQIYAVRAEWVDGRRRPVAVPAALPVGDPAHPERYPAFGGILPPDVAYVGFDLPDDVRGDADPTAGRPGWFFVFQQPRAQTRFGLDATRSESVPGQGPADLSWPAVTVSPSGHVDLAGPLSDLALPGWGLQATSADLAQWCEQKPYRVAIHASDLLAEEDTP
ncbi:hypothetical protein V6V47_01030 [Micromonospora sp. CPCC 205539]|uniref:hypothetical protein n=1 Tax=Micromonospora sp. CPCC 205539 TaxID=3122408 RepID=UPI002FF3B054